MYIGLYQSHLTKLDTHDIIDYNQDRGIIARQPLARALTPFLGEGLDAPQTLQADPDATRSSSSESTIGVLAKLGFSR